MLRDSMSKDSVGVIYGRTGSFAFEFAVPENVIIRRGDYVKVWHEIDGWTMAQVEDVVRTSDTFQLKDALNAAEGAGTANIQERTTARANVVGFRHTDGLLHTPKTPFSPGDKVFRADDEMIRYTLGLVGGDVYLGLLENQKVPVHLNSDDLVQKHVSILAKTGSGKSYTAGVLLEEFLDNGIPLLIIDPHGEYLTLKQPGEADKKLFKKYGITPKGYERQVTVYTPTDKHLNPDADRLFRINEVNLTTNDLAQLFSEDRTQSQTAILYEAISKLKAEKERYTLEDIIFEVGQDRSKTKWNVIHSLERIKETGLLSEKPTTLEELIKPGHASIIDMKGVEPEIQAMIVAKLCTELFEARKNGRIPPCMLVLEEAHNFCPERGFDKTISTEILRTIASEGRKFGLGLLVISQRPARVDKNVLSQCNTQIIMRVTNANDLKALSKGIEGLSGGLEEEIKRLPPGVAMVVSNKIERPILVEVRVRKSKHGGASAAIERGFSYTEAPPEETRVPETSAPEPTVTEASGIKHQDAEPVTAKQILTGITRKPQKTSTENTATGEQTERKEPQKSLLKKIFGSTREN